MNTHNQHYLDKIYNRDCLEGLRELPDKSIDLVVTDPPYEFRTNWQGGGFFNKKRQSWLKEMRDCEFAKGFNVEVLDEVVRVSKTLNAYFFCSVLQVPMYLNFANGGGYLFDILLWQKTNPLPLYNNHYLTDKEYIIFIREKSAPLHIESYELGKTIFHHPINQMDKKKYGHPTIKPLPIIETLIRNSSKEGDLVLDPFMGSGTTAVACVNLKRHYIGYELNKQYYDTATNRLEDNKYKLF